MNKQSKSKIFLIQRLTLENNDLSSIATKVGSFFDKNFKTPKFILDKEKTQQLSRRQLLKSAAGVAAVSALPSFHLAANDIKDLESLTKTDPWLTLNATLNHLLPPATGSKNTALDISAQSINALAYLYQVMTVQPTPQDEKDFILKGVGWLNDYANSEKEKHFTELTTDEKEQLLRGISNSRAGGNWLNTLLGYIFQAMLAPPSYGGNTNGIGWQWLEHQAGFPLPEKGQRYFELPPRAKTKKSTTNSVKDQNNASLQVIPSKTVSTTTPKRSRKA